MILAGDDAQARQEAEKGLRDMLATKAATRRMYRMRGREDRQCDHCGETIPATAHARQRFCGTRCRVAAHRAG